VNATVLVSSRFADLIKSNSSCARGYPAEIYHKGDLLRADLESINFEARYDCADPDRSEVEVLDLGGRTIPYRYRRLTIDRTKLPPEDHIFMVPMCGDLIVTDSFVHDATAAGIQGCVFWPFEGRLL
jgi:hypothetical protein